MFWKKRATTAYLLEHFQRFLDVVEKQPYRKTDKDLLHQNTFLMSYFTVVANNFLNLSAQEVEKFVYNSTRIILARLPNFGLEDLEDIANKTADCIMKANLYFSDAAKEYYDNNIANEGSCSIEKDNFVKTVSTGCAGLITILQRDKFIK